MPSFEVKAGLQKQDPNLTLTPELLERDNAKYRGLLQYCYEKRPGVNGLPVVPAFLVTPDHDTHVGCF